MSNSPGQAEGPSLDPRSQEIYERWAIWGDTQQKIADMFGMTQSRVSQIIKAWRAQNPEVREDLAAQSIAMLKELRMRQFALAEQIKEGAPVAVGKDGNKLYEDDGTPVRDYSGYLKALAEVRLTDAQIAKRMGLDAPDRLETSQTVKYIIEGVAGDALS
jgi:transcriptional regulator with XRE-family HTH domain